MAAKKKVKTVAASKPAASKPAPAKAVAPKEKATSAKPAAGKPIALQTVAKKSAGGKAAKPTAKKGKSGAKRAALNGRAAGIESPKPADSETFYFVVGHMDAQISNQRLPSATEIASSDSFDEVKDKAVDHLIELVDLLERRLWEIKRSQDFASYLALRELT